MCGIAGIIDFKASPSDKALTAMADELVHRGPDEEGIFLDGPVGLVNRRLSILDLSTGSQPIFNEDETVVVVFNGEIYNYIQLRERLEDAGHRFTTETDTEVLVHLYEEEGPSFVQQLDGMFAIALWDAKNRRLVLARDKVGIKPLYLLRHEGRLAFASELPALFPLNAPFGGIDKTAIGQYFAFKYIPSPRTAFENVSKLEPSTQVIVDSDGCTTTRYYTPTIFPRRPGVRGAATDIRSIVEDSVERRLQSDVPVGAFLSGGIDSSIVVSTMAQLRPDPVKTFSIGFDLPTYDESWAARELASHHGTDHHEYTLTAEEAQDLLPDIAERCGEPFADQLLPTYVVSREARNHVKVALSGDGADELFAGYSRYRGEYYSQYYRRIPKQVRGTLEFALDRMPATRSTKFGELVWKANRFTHADGTDPAARRYQWIGNTTAENNHVLDGLDPVDAGEDKIRSEYEEQTSTLAKIPDDTITKMQYLDYRYKMPDQILQKVDRASMYNSLEVRVPLLDTTLAEYAFGLPREYKINRRTQKDVLKKAFDDLLPEAILSRGKDWFGMPVGEWLKHELSTDFEESIRGTEFELLDTDSLFDVYEEHKSDRAEHGNFLWSVYAYAKWRQRMYSRGILSTPATPA